MALEIGDKDPVLLRMGCQGMIVYWESHSGGIMAEKPVRLTQLSSAAG